MKELFTDEEFVKRLVELRNIKNVSAREMSLEIGQSESYISNIENGYGMPSLSVFFYICQYLDITPKDFFDTGAKDPSKATELFEKIKALKPEQLVVIESVINSMK
ncbi:MAG: helix-turn-helix transcriptional regulator [Clostridia bacterium]|nr:helix-turn-helix transcriptional regulator [Clostridia bacterium]